MANILIAINSPTILYCRVMAYSNIAKKHDSISQIHVWTDLDRLFFINVNAIYDSSNGSVNNNGSILLNDAKN